MRTAGPLSKEDVWASVSAIPIIDFADFGASEPETRRVVAERIGEACTAAGFFYLVNHGIPVERRDRIFDSMEWLFALSPDAKRQYWRTAESPRGYYRASEVYEQAGEVTRESFIVMADPTDDEAANGTGNAAFGRNRWPEGRPHLEDDVMAYFDSASRLALELCEAFALALNLPSDRVERNYRHPLSNLQLNFYPGQPGNGAAEIGLPPHRDTGGFTILATDDNAGLQVMGPGGEWIDAPVMSGAVIVNVGNMLEMQTNRRFKSVVHRVVNRGSAPRYSLPFFVNPGWDAEIWPEPEFLEDEESQYSEPLEFGPWYFNILYGSRTNSRKDLETEVQAGQNASRSSTPDEER